MKPDVKLYDDHIEIAGPIKGDINNGGNVDIDAGNGSINAHEITASELSVGSDSSPGSIAVPSGSISSGSINANDLSVAGSLQLDGANLRGIGDELIVGASIITGKLSVGSINAKDLSVVPGLDGVFTVSYWTKEDHTVEGWLAKNLYLKPDGILFTTKAESQGTTFFFDLLPEFNTLTARVSALENILKQQIRKEAYQLWEAGGRQSDKALDDWLAAERDVLGL